MKGNKFVAVQKYGVKKNNIMSEFKTQQTSFCWVAVESKYEIKKQKWKEVVSAIWEKCGVSSKKSYSFEEISQELQKIKDDVRKLDHRYLRSNERLSVDKFRKICRSEQLPFAIVQKEVERKQMYWFCSLDEDDNGKRNY